jgi:hypothetical protein
MGPPAGMARPVAVVRPKKRVMEEDDFLVSWGNLGPNLGELPPPPPPLPLLTRRWAVFVFVKAKQWFVSTMPRGTPRSSAIVVPSLHARVYVFQLT